MWFIGRIMYTRGRALQTQEAFEEVQEVITAVVLVLVAVVAVVAVEWGKAFTRWCRAL